jgi:putative phosphoesterase
MRVAVISDMHGNAIAFDAVLADIREHGADQVVCLGDALQGGPQPGEVVERLWELGCPVVLGNADDFLLTGEDDDGHPVTEQQLAARAWSVAQLGDGIAAIESFQPTVEIELPGERRLLCFHGSPTSFNDILLPETSDEDVQRLLGPYLPAFQCGGHTHLQQLRRVGDSFFFNPGSVGLAWDRRQPVNPPLADPWAEYAILSAGADTLAVEFRRVPYDVAALLRIIRSSGIPDAEALADRYSRRAGL